MPPGLQGNAVHRGTSWASSPLNSESDPGTSRRTHLASPARPGVRESERARPLPPGFSPRRRWKTSSPAGRRKVSNGIRRQFGAGLSPEAAREHHSIWAEEQEKAMGAAEDTPPAQPVE